ncbi:helix-turn-helix domain-containing protein [Streptomyces sp. NPDC096310]|uniref:helix-turn-helix domain-containing protein n=1 Tax=Streptomyces sp. NPDC096310 TaxID=3366082 RepID=UPI0037FEAC6A
MEPEDWKRLGREFAAARTRAGLSQVELGERIGVSRGPIQTIERGHTKGVSPARVSSTMRSYASFLGWTDDSIEAILQGGKPTLTQPESERMPGGERIPLRIAAELRDGQILDDGVFDLSPDDEHFQLLIMVKGKEGATPEEVSAYMDKWRKVERGLRRMGEGEGGANSPGK